MISHHLDTEISNTLALLQERVRIIGNSRYFSHRPAWIRSARNRRKILKAILRLEKMASTIQPSTKKVKIRS